MTEVTAVRPEHCEALLAFFRALPGGDRTFIEEDVTDLETVRGWTTGANRWVAVEGADVHGYVAEQGAALALFTGLGFGGEALLRDHIRDREGRLRDLLVLAHHVGATWSAMGTVGIPDDLGEPG